MFVVSSFDECKINGTYKVFEKYKMYQGEVKDKKKHGLGKEYDKNTSISYTGSYYDDKKHGRGKEIFNNVVICDGSYVDGLMHGYCQLYYNNNVLKYDGYMFKNKYHGSGRLYNINGELIYDGEFSKGVFHGIGLYKISNYEYHEYISDYKGNFKYGLFDGVGKEWYKNGCLRYEGNYEAGLYSGYGKLWYDNEQLQYEGKFLAGEMLQPELIYHDNGCIKCRKTGNNLYVYYDKKENIVAYGRYIDKVMISGFQYVEDIGWIKIYNYNIVEIYDKSWSEMFENGKISFKTI
jgi:antitoxin component YwqK of YwqJK toxin-antitoxin module